MTSLRIRRRSTRGFTLVEILIVVIILGILAAIVIPQFTNASQDARKNSLTSQLQTVRSQVELYRLQHLDQLPPSLVAGGAGATPWTEMNEKTNADHTTTGTPTFGPYLQSAPVNPLNGNTGVGIVSGTTDFGSGGAASTGTVGFILNSTTGKVWATSAKFGYIYSEANPSATTNDQ